MANYNGRAVQVIDREAEAHNAKINDMYALLQNAESEQLEQLWAEAKQTPKGSVVAPEKPAEKTTYEHTPVQSDLFTPAALDKTLEKRMPVYVPHQNVYTPVQPVPTQQESAAEATFSLTSAAKKAIAIFASAATVMMTMICVNTHLINAREAEIARLEASNASARARLTQIREDIEYYSSEEVIRQWAEENGLVQK